jgi:hypothetical protein
MPQHLAPRTRSIAKQTVLGVIATLAVVTGASMALAADGDEETPVIADEATSTTCPADDGSTEDTATEDTATDDGSTEDTATEDTAVDPEEPVSGDTTSCDTGETSTTTTTSTTEPDEDGAEELDEETPVTELDEVVESEDDEFRNHGEAVSKAAREDCEPGPGHGACVSEVARSDAGKKGAEDGDEPQEPAEVEEPDEADETEEAPADGPGNGNGVAKGNQGGGDKPR